MAAADLHRRLEAMACGCAVVVSGSGACPETAGGAALLADPTDPSDHAAKMLSVLEDPALLEAMRERSLERAAFFSCEKTAQAVLERITRTVSGSAA